MLVGINYIDKSLGEGNFTDIRSNLYLLFTSLAMQLFKWESDSDIPNEMFELNLILRGQSLYFDLGGNRVNLPCVQSGELNVYGKPTIMKAVAYNGGLPDITRVVSKTSIDGKVMKPDGVWIRNNIYNIPTIALLTPFINRLCYLWECMGINQAMSRAKLIIEANETQAKTLKKEIMRIFGTKNPFLIVKDKQFSDNLVKGVINNNVEYMCDKYWFDFDKLLTYVLTFLGINNNFSSEKRERLLVGEVEANNEIVDYFKDTMLSFRENACKEIENVFGDKISVKENIDRSMKWINGNTRLNSDNIGDDTVTE